MKFKSREKAKSMSRNTHTHSDNNQIHICIWGGDFYPEPTMERLVKNGAICIDGV